MQTKQDTRAVQIQPTAASLQPSPKVGNTATWTDPPK